MISTGAYQCDVYVGDFDPKTAVLRMPTRLTMSDGDEAAFAWTPDNRSLILSSSRVGRQLDIYGQDMDAKVPQLLVTSDDDKFLPRVTADGRWILFTQAHRFASDLSDTRVMRAAIDGGLATEIFASLGEALPQCSRKKGCILYDARGNQATLSVLDPVGGKGAELARIPPVQGGFISPDETEFAYIVEDGLPRNHIRIISFMGKPPQDVSARDATFMGNIDWLPDGSGWLSMNASADRTELIYTTRDGRSRVLWAPERMQVVSAIPSRDGKRPAINTMTTTGNAWMMTGY